jgi:hypothetical protein
MNEEEPKDARELLVREGRDAVRTAVQNAEPLVIPSEDEAHPVVVEHGDVLASANDEDECEFQRLAGLSRVAYDRERKLAAKDLGIRESTLDREVEGRRDTAEAAESLQIIEELEPWEDPVDLSDIAAEVEDLLCRHLVLPPHGGLAMAMWAAAAYVQNSFRIFPELLINSPTKRCGKSTALEIMAAVAPRALVASNISPAAIYRVIEAVRPTLMIDEIDSFLRDNDEMRGIVNSAHTRATARVIRCDGDNNEVKPFSTWTPLVLAGIGDVADTVMDRAIVITLQRKGPGGKVTSIPIDLAERMLPLRRKLFRWAEDNGQAIKMANPLLPDHENDRALNNWMPLFALAERMGGDWLERIRIAFGEMESEQDDDIKTKLLGDIRVILQNEENEDGEGVVVDEHVLSGPLLERLANLEERPWARWHRGNPISANALARLLEGFDLRSRQKKLLVELPELGQS